MLGLPVPGEGLIESRQHLGMPAPKLVVDRHEAQEATHAPLARRAQAEQPHQLRREREPRRVGVKLELEARHGAAHAVLERLPRVPDVVAHRSVPFLRDQSTEKPAQEPVERSVLVRGEPLHGNAIDHREAHAVAQLPTNRRHRVGAGREGEVSRGEEQHRERVLPEGADQSLELGHRLVRERHDPVRRRDPAPGPGTFVANVLEKQSAPILG